MKMNEYKTVDEYISNFSPEVQKTLQKIRETIQAAAPEATEKISYAIPTFALHGNLVHFAAFENHYGFYPGPSGVVAFADKLTSYETTKGTVKFPLAQPVPYDLIRDITAFRVKENQTKKK